MREMRRFYTVLALTLMANIAQAQDFYMQKQNEVEFKRLNQEVYQLKKDIEQHSIYVRQLEKTNESLTKKLEATNQRVDDLLDLWVNFENVSLPNLVSSDKALAQRINDTNNHIKEQTPAWNWGEQSRDCPSIGRSQQVKTVQTDNGNASTRYLCFDGKILHLNTVSNIPPVQ